MFEVAFILDEKLFLEIIYKFDPNVFFSIVISFRKYRNDIKNAITESLFIKRASEKEREISKNKVEILKSITATNF